LYRKSGDIEQSIQLFTNSANMITQFRHIQLACLFETGWCYLLKLNWEISIDIFESFLDEWKSPSYKAFCAYLLGYAYHMANKKEKALEALEKVKGWTRKHFSFDEYAQFRADEYILNEGLSTIKEELFVMELLTFGLKHREDTLSYIENSTVFKNEDELEYKAIAIYYKGKALRSLDKFQEAKESFDSVLDMQSHFTVNIQILPLTIVELGEIAIEENDFARARELFDETKNYSNYIMEKIVVRRVEKSLDYMKIKA